MTRADFVPCYKARFYACIDPCQQLQYAVFETSVAHVEWTKKGKEETAHTWINEGILCFLVLTYVALRNHWFTRIYGHTPVLASCLMVKVSQLHGTWHVTMDTRHLPSAATELHLSAEQTVKLSNGQAIEVVKFHNQYMCVCSMSSIYIYICMCIWYVCVSYDYDMQYVCI